MPPVENRRIVTIVFSDLKGSTALGEQLDPEAVREVLARYFDAMRAELERHGGTIEKFIGDAVMAVFGLDAVHEDDALRAVRAAAGMGAALEDLNDELEARYGVRLANRTGVNTGEVVAGDPTAGQRLVTGDTVNTTARLEQAAPENQVLLGPVTYALVRDAVEAEPVEPLVLKGKAEPVPAWRLVRVRAAADGRARREDTPLVGRAAELAALRGALAGAVATRAARLVVLTGDAGVGKSRLVRELIADVEGSALALRGRCLSYGEGITFWPIGEIVRAAAGIDEEDAPAAARAKLLAIAPDRDVAARVASIVGLSSATAPLPEVFWGVRRLLEELARRQPLVVVIDDVHWAEPALLDLLDHLLGAAEDAPDPRGGHGPPGVRRRASRLADGRRPGPDRARAARRGGGRGRRREPRRRSGPARRGAPRRGHRRGEPALRRAARRDADRDRRAPPRGRALGSGRRGGRPGPAAQHPGARRGPARPDHAQRARRRGARLGDRPPVRGARRRRPRRSRPAR